MNQIKKGYKQTKVGIVPENWKIVRLGDICKFYKGKGISKENLSEEGTPCIRYGELYTTYNEKIDNVISKTNVDIKELFFSKYNDIIIPASGETAIDIATASCVLHDNIALSGDLNVIRTKENGIFLSYYLNVVAKHRIASIAQGVSVVHLYSSQLENLFLSLPPFKEQEKIAEILTICDEVINRQKELIDEKVKQKKALTQKLLSGEVRFGSFNDKWNEIQVSQVFQNIGGTSLESEVIENGKYKFISIGNYSVDGRYIDNQQRVNLNKKTKDKLLYKDNLVMVLNDKTASGDLIGSTILINEDNTFIYNQRSERLICSNKIVPLYAWFKLNSKDFRKKIFSLSQGGTQIYINFPAVKKIKIKLPSLQEQGKIAEVLSLSDNEIDLLKKELEELKQQKKALMQKLLTGEVRVKV